MWDVKRPRFRNLALFWKLLVPFLTLMVMVGAFGVFLIMRDLSSRAQAALEQDVARRSLEARSSFRDRELYLLESGTFASNLEGMAAAVTADDRGVVGQLLQSVLALKTDLELAAVTDRRGKGLVEFSRSRSSDVPSFGRDTPWAANPFVKQALTDGQGGKYAGFLKVGDKSMLAIAAPICASVRGCGQVGVSIVATGVERLAETARGIPARGDDEPASDMGVSIYDIDGVLLASAGLSAGGGAPPPDPGRGTSVTRRVESQELLTLFAPLDVQRKRVGTLAVTVPTEPALSSVRGAGFGLSLIVLAAMMGVVGVGAILSRFILAQVKPLVETNRALGRGELDARAPVLGDDELGELARGVNQMAEQLQASYETLESRVAQRTEEVQRLLGERTEFFVGLSHELRTPLAIIRNRVKLMDDPAFAGNAAWMRETTQVMDASAAQLLSLVDDVLELARAETVGLKMDLTEFPLSDVLGDVQPTLAGLAASGGIAFDVKLPRDLPPVRADRGRLREVLLNLVDNAVKYTPAGGNVSLTASGANGHVTVSVSDDGQGVPPSVGDLIFQPFYRIEGATVHHGAPSSGLGLALTKRLVEAQGGSIAFSPNADGGTTFTFTLEPSKPRTPKRRAGQSSGR